jgi:hypothetical protein
MSEFVARVRSNEFDRCAASVKAPRDEANAFFCQVRSDVSERSRVAERWRRGCVADSGDLKRLATQQIGQVRS